MKENGKMKDVAALASAFAFAALVTGVRAETWTWVGGSEWSYKSGQMVHDTSGKLDWCDGYNWKDSSGNRGTMYPDPTRRPDDGDILVFDSSNAHVSAPKSGAYGGVEFGYWPSSMNGPTIPIADGGYVIVSGYNGRLNDLSYSSPGSFEFRTAADPFYTTAPIYSAGELRKTGTGQHRYYQPSSTSEIGTYRLQGGSLRLISYDKYTNPIGSIKTAFVFDGANTCLDLNALDSTMTCAFGETANAMGHSIVSPAGAATLTVSGDQVNTSFSGTFSDAVSFVWNPTAVDAEHGTLALRGTGSDTMGTLTIASGAVAFLDGIVPFAALVVADGAFVRADGIVAVASGKLTVTDATVADGVYCSTAHASMPGVTAVAWMTGNGLLAVGPLPDEPTTVEAAWTTAGEMSVAANWNGAAELPPITDGSVLMKVTGGASATVDGDYWLKGVDIGIDSFLMQATGSHLLRLGSLGFVTPGLGKTYEVSAPIAPVGSQTWTVGNADTLKLTGALRSVGPGTLAIAVQGANSQVEFRGSSPDFVNDLEVSGYLAVIYGEDSLGGLGGTTTFSCPNSPQVKGTVQHRPIVVTGTFNPGKNSTGLNLFLGKVWLCAGPNQSKSSVMARGGRLVFGGGLDLGYPNEDRDGSVNDSDGGSVVVSNGVLRTLGKDRLRLDGGELHLYSPNNEINIVQMGYVRGEGTTLYTHAPNAIYASRLNFAGNQPGGSIWDLCGCDQTVKYFQGGRGSTLAENKPSTVRSATPALLHLEDEANIYSPGTSSTSSATNWAYFVGAAGFSKDGPFKDHSLVQISSSTGTVQVTNGSLYFRKNCIYNGVDYGDRGSWPKASKAIAKGTGTLVFEHGASIGRKTNVEIADSGRIQIDAGVVQQCRSLTIGGVLMAEGTWGSPDSAAEHKDAAFTGTGVLDVCAHRGLLIFLR